MKLNNERIYALVNNYSQEFAEFNSYIPARANFAIQKNMSTLTAAAQDIEAARMGVFKHYGELNAEGTAYDIPADKQEAAIKELTELFQEEQEIEIKMISIDSLGSAEFTPAQMQAIMFMIED